LADVYDLAADVEALNRVAAGLKVIDPDVQVSQLYIRGDRYSYRCDCGCNVFVKHGPDSFQCNSCGKRYETE
jgi:rRNA maturation endonuclease Nob1